jgi:YD repeat-containing protein
VEYDILDHPTAIRTQIDATRSRNLVKVYDSSERLIEEILENSQKTVYEYDRLDRVTHVGVWAKDANGVYQRISLENRTYDLNGNVISTTDER